MGATTDVWNFQSMFLEESVFTLIYIPKFVFFKNTYLLKYELNKLDNFKIYVSVI